MAPRDKIGQKFFAQAGPTPWLFALSWLFAFLMKYRVVAVTDRNVVLLESSSWTPSKPRSVATRLPRQTRFGEIKGVWAKVDLAGERYFVHKRFHGDVRAADAELG